EHGIGIPIHAAAPLLLRRGTWLLALGRRRPHGHGTQQDHSGEESAAHIFLRFALILTPNMDKSHAQRGLEIDLVLERFPRRRDGPAAHAAIPGGNWPTRRRIWPVDLNVATALRTVGCVVKSLATGQNPVPPGLLPARSLQRAGSI